MRAIVRETLDDLLNYSTLALATFAVVFSTYNLCSKYSNKDVAPENTNTPIEDEDLKVTYEEVLGVDGVYYRAYTVKVNPIVMQNEDGTVIYMAPEGCYSVGTGKDMVCFKTFYEPVEKVSKLTLNR